MASEVSIAELSETKPCNPRETRVQEKRERCVRHFLGVIHCTVLKVCLGAVFYDELLSHERRDRVLRLLLPFSQNVNFACKPLFASIRLPSTRTGVAGPGKSVFAPAGRSVPEEIQYPVERYALLERTDGFILTNESPS